MELLSGRTCWTQHNSYSSYFCFTLLLRKLPVQNWFLLSLKEVPSFSSASRIMWQLQLFSCWDLMLAGCPSASLWLFDHSLTKLEAWCHQVQFRYKGEGNTKCFPATPCLAKAPKGILFFSLPGNVHLLQFRPTLAVWGGSVVPLCWLVLLGEADQVL